MDEHHDDLTNLKQLWRQVVDHRSLTCYLKKSFKSNHFSILYPMKSLESPY